jgi:hypothetical protein
MSALLCARLSAWPIALSKNSIELDPWSAVLAIPVVIGRRLGDMPLTITSFRMMSNMKVPVFAPHQRADVDIAPRDDDAIDKECHPRVPFRLNRNGTLDRDLTCFLYANRYPLRWKTL